MKFALAPLLACLALPALADVDRVIDAHILPGYAAFAEEAAELEQAAQSCDRAAIRPAWNAAFDAWMKVSHLRLGPIEQDGRILAVAFWPDTRGATPSALQGLIADEDPIIETPEGTTQLSVAARGVYALEYLLYDPQFAGDGYTCTLIAALSGDLNRIAGAVDADWRDGFAETLRSAGDPGNQTYLSEREAKQALFTALTTGLEFDADQRLGRPMGSFDRPRPARAEARRSGRSLRNLRLSLVALHDLAGKLADSPIPQSDAAFAHALDLIGDLDDPVFAGVETPQGRLKVEAIQQAVRAAREAVLTEIGPSLGVSAGFNSADGD